MQQLQQHAEGLRQDLNLPTHPQTGPVQAMDEEEVLKPLQQELQHRLWQAEDLDATLAQTQGALRTAEQMLQVQRLHTHGSGLSCDWTSSLLKLANPLLLRFGAETIKTNQNKPITAEDDDTENDYAEQI